MKNFVLSLTIEIDNELTQLDQSRENQIAFAKLAFELYQTKKEKLKKELLRFRFKDDLEEIHFFKEIKPLIESKILLFSEIFQIESKCLDLTKELKIATYKEEQEKISKYFKSKKEYFNYYKTRNSLSDQYYFLRNNGIHLYSKFNNIDFSYSTGYDQFFIKIIAFEQLNEYFQNRIFELDNPELGLQVSFKSDLSWTADQVDMIELIYALKENKAINDGNVTIKKLISVFEIVFNFKVNDTYRTYTDIKNRNNPFAFLENCIEALEKKIEREL